MANKYFGAIGFSDTVETSPGVYTENVIERNYYGDVLDRTFRYESDQQVNDNINISNRISIVSDSYIISHTHKIRYIVLWGQKWKIKSAEVKYPRIILSIGDEYNN